MNTRAWAGVPGTGLTQAQLLAWCSTSLSSCSARRLAPDMRVPKGVKNPVFYGQQPEKKVPVSSGHEIKQTPVVLAMLKGESRPLTRAWAHSSP